MSKKDQFRNVVEFVRQLTTDGIVCGASLGLLYEDGQQLFYDGNQGVIDPYQNRAIEAGLYYDLASLSKVIGTSTRILQLMEDGVLKRSSRVSGILSRFQYTDITLEHLLLHNSGLPAEIRNKKVWSRENLEDLLYTTEPECKPEEQFIYSDVGFILLGKIIEAMDSMTLEESYRQYIFAPLKMEHTSFFPPDDKRLCVPTECTGERGCICGEVHDRKAWLLGPCGSAGLFSTLEDLAIFVRAYLNRSDHLFGAETFRLLEQIECFGRTLGWSREYGAGTLYHTGFTGTSIWMDLEQKAGMILLTNRIHPSRENTEFLEKRKEINQIFCHK